MYPTYFHQRNHHPGSSFSLAEHFASILQSYHAVELLETKQYLLLAHIFRCHTRCRTFYPYHTIPYFTITRLLQFTIQYFMCTIPIPSYHSFLPNLTYHVAQFHPLHNLQYHSIPSPNNYTILYHSTLPQLTIPFHSNPSLPNTVHFHPLPNLPSHLMLHIKFNIPTSWLPQSLN